MDWKYSTGFGKLLKKREAFLSCLTILVFLILWQLEYVLQVFRPAAVQFQAPKDPESSIWKDAPPIIEAVNRRVELVDIQGMDQRDKYLIYFVRSHFIELPSVLEYSFGKGAALKYLDPEVDNVVYPLFKNKTNGFFVEVGAYDGLNSHTLILERDYKWSGLLIECNPQLLPKLRSVNRKAYISDACLSNTNHPVKTKMTSMDKWLASSSLGSGNLYPSWIKSNFTTFEVQAIPLYSIVASIDITQVDLIVLDVQSLELDVLKHFPFELILVKVWVVEIYFYSAEQKNALMSYMAQKGYPGSRIIKLTNDYVFVHNSLK